MNTVMHSTADVVSGGASLSCQILGGDTGSAACTTLLAGHRDWGDISENRRCAPETSR